MTESEKLDASPAKGILQSEPIRDLASRAYEDRSPIGKTARAALLAVGLGLAGLGGADAIDVPMPWQNYETALKENIVLKDNIEGDPFQYFLYSLLSIGITRVRIKSKR